MFRKYLILPLCAALFASCSAINEELPSYADTSIITVGDSAPDFEATLLDGERITLSELRTNEVLLILFSHTCPDCKALLDDMKGAEEHFNALGVRLLLVARDGNEEQIAAYMQENAYTFDVVADPERTIYNLYATMYVPRTYLIDTEGVVVHTTVEYEESHIAEILNVIK